MRILGIESSCDETAAAVAEDGTRILSSVVASQVDVHSKYGGVVPELASRKHVEAIVPVVNEALEAAGVTPESLDGVAATQGPGLVGALLVGFSFAKGYAYARKLPFLGVNHLEGHVHSVFLDAESPPPYPYVALLASGGHTSLYHVTGPTAMEVMGQTRDDAAGEAFDKVSKMTGLGYPGGAAIGKLAVDGDPAKIAFPRAYISPESFDFSFSGLKTAVNRYLQTHSDSWREEIADVAASFEEAVVEVLAVKLMRAAEFTGAKHLAVVGGVAANHRLRERVRREAESRGYGVHIPPLSLCGDNAAMIAGVAHARLLAGERSGLDADVYSRHKKG
ncbi:MAG: tRNA (adenosine(37)-N6)-threonylcarbamoyltransferase complex transferase subunit TsaD [Desulfococcaceae bacterium]